MLGDLALVVSNLRLRDGADRIIGGALGGRVVGGQNGGYGPDDGADLVVHLLRFGLVDDVLEGGALLGIGGLRAVGNGHGRVLGEVLVVLCLRADDGADLTWLGEVDVGVGWGKNGIGGSNNGADSWLRHGDSGSKYGVEEVELGCYVEMALKLMSGGSITVCLLKFGYYCCKVKKEVKWRGQRDTSLVKGERTRSQY